MSTNLDDVSGERMYWGKFGEKAKPHFTAHGLEKDVAREQSKKARQRAIHDGFKRHREKVAEIKRLGDIEPLMVVITLNGERITVW